MRLVYQLIVILAVFTLFFHIVGGNDTFTSRSIPPLTALVTYPATQEPLTEPSCTYPAKIVALYLYNSSIPGDETRVRVIAQDNLNRAQQWYASALADVNQKLSSRGYETISPGTNEYTLQGWDILNLPAGFGAALRPIRENIIDDTGNIIGVQINFPAADILFINSTQNPTPPITHSPSNELIIVADKVVDNILKCGLTEPQQGMITISSQRPGSISAGCDFQPQVGYGVLFHEMGHSLGLDHYPANSSNLMYTPHNPADGIYPTDLKPNQLMALLAHVCGTPNDKVTLKGQSGRFGVNIHYTPAQYICGNGLIGGEEECENSLELINHNCVSPNPSLNPQNIDVPWWPDTRRCMTDCRCVAIRTSGSLPPFPGPPRYRPEPDGTLTGCRSVPGAQCWSHQMCPSNSQCNAATCTCQPFTGSCDPANNQNHQCADDTDCQPGRVCDTAHCVCHNPCGWRVEQDPESGIFYSVCVADGSSPTCAEGQQCHNTGGGMGNPDSCVCG